MVDEDELAELRAEARKPSERCQCDVEFGMCPGVRNCPYSDDQQEGEPNENYPKS